MAPSLLAYTSPSCHYSGLFVEFSDQENIAHSVKLPQGKRFLEITFL